MKIGRGREGTPNYSHVNIFAGFDADGKAWFFDTGSAGAQSGGNTYISRDVIGSMDVISVHRPAIVNGSGILNSYPTEAPTVGASTYLSGSSSSLDSRKPIISSKPGNSSSSTSSKGSNTSENTSGNSSHLHFEVGEEASGNTSSSENASGNSSHLHFETGEETPGNTGTQLGTNDDGTHYGYDYFGAPSGSNSSKISPEAEKILEAADQVHRQQTKWQYGTSGLINNDIEKSMVNPAKVTSSPTYVGQVLFVSKFITKDELNSFNYNSIEDMRKHIENECGWKTIIDYKDLRMGDIVFLDYNNGGTVDDHVLIYAGDDTWYSGGGDYVISGTAPYKDTKIPRENFNIAFRPETVR